MRTSYALDLCVRLCMSANMMGCGWNLPEITENIRWDKLNIISYASECALLTKNCGGICYLMLPFYLTHFSFLPSSQLYRLRQTVCQAQRVHLQ